MTLHAAVWTLSPAVPGKEARRDSEYKRWGTDLQLAMVCPKAETIHLVLDHLNIHSSKSVMDLLKDQVGTEVWNRFTVHDSYPESRRR